MSLRLDLIVFGASGFTGKCVVDNLVRLCQKEPYRDLRWGIAGRSLKKLQSVLLELRGLENYTSTVPIVIADAHNEESLRLMSAKTKVLMNCVGPYAVLGEAVVKACITTGTHYADITAELYFMLKMYRTYNKAADDANVLIVTACGYGSVPATMGLVHLEKEFQGQLHSVECYSELQIPKRLYLPRCNNTLVHYGTWDSLVHEFANYDEYNKMKNEVFSEDIYGSDVENIQRFSHDVHVSDIFVNTISKWQSHACHRYLYNVRRPFFFSGPIVDTSVADMIKEIRSFFHKRNGKFWFPYPGPDQDIIDMTQRNLCENEMKKKPFHFRIYTTMPALYHLFILVPVFFFYFYASAFKCFRKLLRKFPGFFTLGYISRKGPSKKNMRETKFSFTLTGSGTGWNENTSDQIVDSKIQQIDKSLTVKVSGADAYTTTAIAFIFCAITILKDEKKMPNGGVLTTGAAFYNTSLVERLNSNGLCFETIK